MSGQPYTHPEHNKSAFNCPKCNAFANQTWGAGMTLVNSRYNPVKDVMFSLCTHCENHSIWVGSELIYPASSQAPLPNQDLPADILPDYEEASNIVGSSPRGAAALLRLCIQKLCKLILDNS